MKHTISSLLAAFLLAGCAGAGAIADRVALDAGRFDLVQPGMTGEETINLLGSPYEKMRFPLSGNEAWNYLYQDPWGYLASYGVTFGPDGRVVSKISQRLNDGGDHGGH
ncbi:MAG TPA: hypothetical protein VII36_09235 [Usitatibacter sp.]